jgi:predicted membrane chloride channel (bestrophin family)
METLRHALRLMDSHLIGVVLASLIATGIAQALDFEIDLPADIIGVAVIFPIVFSIAGAYERREDALRQFASLKANAVALYYAHRDWPVGAAGLGVEGAQLVRELLHEMGHYFTAPDAEKGVAMHRAYRVCDQLSVSHEHLRDAGVSPTEISRVSQYLRDAMLNFESMRNFSLYRTPVALRAYSRLFVTVLPVMFAPYFAYVGQPDFPWVGFVIAALYSTVLVGLDNIQDELENPYDGIGPDDLHLDVADEYVDMITADGIGVAVPVAQE